MKLNDARYYEQLREVFAQSDGCQQTQFAKTSKVEDKNEFTNTSSDKQDGESLCKLRLLAVSRSYSFSCRIKALKETTTQT